MLLQIGKIAVLAGKLTGSGAAYGRLRQPLERSPRLLFRGFLGIFFPEAHADIDWGRPYESLDKELQQIAPEAEIGRRYVDKLVKVGQSGEEQWVLIHIEVQMTDEADFPWRMYVYNCRIFVMYNRGWPDEFWIEVKQHEEKEHKPFITTPERYGRMEGLADGIETILEARFPDASNQLMLEDRRIFDHEQLQVSVPHSGLRRGRTAKSVGQWFGQRRMQ